MPHVVVKAMSAGSIGDLAAITGALEGLDVNILAIGAGEGLVGQQEVGAVSMIIAPEDATTLDNVVNALQGLTLRDNRTLADVEVIANIEVELPNTVGALKVAADAIDTANLNIRSIVMTGFGVETAHVGLGFAQADEAAAHTALEGAGITIVNHDH